MNAISAVALATGQDWRAIEAGCHAYVAVGAGGYGPMARWTKTPAGDLREPLEAVRVPAEDAIVDLVVIDVLRVRAAVAVAVAAAAAAAAAAGPGRGGGHALVPTA